MYLAIATTRWYIRDRMKYIYSAKLSKYLDTRARTPRALYLHDYITTATVA